jgi:hypothetical protein
LIVAGSWALSHTSNRGWHWWGEASRDPGQPSRLMSIKALRRSVMKA